ncbi:uncharacterized protein LOC111379425 isoform X1 [Olea europaea var. sylvestris]|uniref:uncharacterized protein LOC111379425 isoform X1 n=1 Tax=Olea europaea var. sylvestris TaxID=158386 RepID=UPI000C1CE6FF|nr:uncharacterized protein LOC111379425 isoform X1 [Olea europaea var. sylvestris]
MDTNDFCAISQQLKDQVVERYPGARLGLLKTGGDFPFLSRPDEVNLHLQLHLRRVGVDARQDLVRGVPKDGPGGSSSEQNSRKGDPDDAPEDDKRDIGSSSNENEPPLTPEGTDSQNLESTPLLLHLVSDNEQTIASNKVLPNLTFEFIILSLLLLYLETLYNDRKCRNLDSLCR